MPARHASTIKPTKNKHTAVAGGPARHTSRTKRVKSHNILVFFLTFLASLIAGINVVLFKTRPPEVITIDTSTDEHAFWQKIVTKNPTYRDGYLVLYQLEKKNGNSRELNRLIGKAVSIDPFVNEVNSGLVLSATK